MSLSLDELMSGMRETREVVVHAGQLRRTGPVRGLQQLQRLPVVTLRSTVVTPVLGQDAQGVVDGGTPHRVEASTLGHLQSLGERHLGPVVVPVPPGVVAESDQRLLQPHVPLTARLRAAQPLHRLFEMPDRGGVVCHFTGQPGECEPEADPVDHVGERRPPRALRQI